MRLLKMAPIIANTAIIPVNAIMLLYTFKDKKRLFMYAARS